VYETDAPSSMLETAVDGRAMAASASESRCIELFKVAVEW